MAKDDDWSPTDVYGTGMDAHFPPVDPKEQEEFDPVDPDDELLEETPSDVLALLGFHPRELEDEDDDDDTDEPIGNPE